MKKSLKTMLSEFLKPRSKSKNGGWAEVAEGDIEKLYKIVRKILEMKYERDCDNSLPIEFSFVDRTKCERSHYFFIPYEHKAKSNDERMEILSRLSCNAKMAVEALERHIRMMDLIRRQDEKENKADLAP